MIAWGKSVFRSPRQPAHPVSTRLSCPSRKTLRGEAHCGDRMRSCGPRTLVGTGAALGDRPVVPRRRRAITQCRIGMPCLHTLALGRRRAVAAPVCKLKLIASISRHVAEAGGGDLRNSKFSRAVVGRACSHAVVERLFAWACLVFECRYLWLTRIYNRFAVL